MKRAGRLYERIVEWDNLQLAVWKAMRGHRSSAEARAFTHRLHAELERLSEGLRAGTYPLGRVHQFVIYDPKERTITAPCFAERVLHHAVMNVCEPELERWLVADTFACRVGKGRNAALKRAQQYAARFPFFLKIDIRKYFDSVPHEVLLQRLGQRFKDRRVLDLLERIVRSYHSEIGRGLPSGSLTSQHLANFYLGWFDRFVKEQMRLKGYVRYMDDMAFWSDDKMTLKEALSTGETFLKEQLGLDVKPWPYLNRTEHGMDFLGARVFRHHTALNRRSRVRYRRQLAQLEARHQLGEIGEDELQRRVTALTAFAGSGIISSWRFRTSVIERLPVSGQGVRLE
jgi:hypothetical protein